MIEMDIEIDCNLKPLPKQNEKEMSMIQQRRTLFIYVISANHLIVRATFIKAKRTQNFYRLKNICVFLFLLQFSFSK